MLERGIKMNKYLKNTALSLFTIFALSNITFGQDFFLGIISQLLMQVRILKPVQEKPFFWMVLDLMLGMDQR